MTEEEQNEEAGKRFRKLIAGGENAEDFSGSPLDRLKKSSPKTNKSVPAQLTAAQITNKTSSPAQKLAMPKIKLPKMETGSFFGPTLWNIASVISMGINVIMLIVLLVLSFNIRNLDINNLLTLPINLVSGLHTNFQKMDNAHINTNIQVQSIIPVKFDLKLNQATNVVLSQDVVINNARVTVQTGGLNITQALTTIVLPQGTTLPIILDLSVPVDTTIPILLTVPVDIPLKDTQLHEPFVGLQEVVKPIYCIISPGAFDLAGQAICQ